MPTITAWPGSICKYWRSVATHTAPRVALIVLKLYRPRGCFRSGLRASFAIRLVAAHCTQLCVLPGARRETNVGGRQAIVRDGVLDLGNDLRMPVVALGTSEALYAMQADPQIASRFEPFALPR